MLHVTNLDGAPESPEPPVLVLDKKYPKKTPKTIFNQPHLLIKTFIEDCRCLLACFYINNELVPLLAASLSMIWQQPEMD